MNAGNLARIAGIKDTQARSVCAGLYPPPQIMVGRETRVIRARIPEWLDQEAARQLEEKRPGAGAWECTATEPEDEHLLRAL